MQPKDWRPSREILRFIARREGLVLVPYRDGAGWSIGLGHYLGADPKNHNPITPAAALKLLQADIESRAEIVRTIIWVPIEQWQGDAMLELLYQGGTDGLRACATIINARDPKDATSCLTSDRKTAREILYWDTDAAGNHLPGLLRRRGRTVAIWCSGEYGSDLDTIPIWDSVDGKTGKPLMRNMRQITLCPEDLV